MTTHVKISHRGTEGTEGFALGARGELFTGCENHAEAQRPRRNFFCDGKFSHGGHGETEGLTFGKISHRGTEGTEGTEGLALGARGGLFTGWKNHAEARRARRIFLRWGILARRARRDGGAHIGENITQRHRGHRGARAWRARWISSRGGLEVTIPRSFLSGGSRRC